MNIYILIIKNNRQTITQLLVLTYSTQTYFSNVSIRYNEVLSWQLWFFCD